MTDTYEVRNSTGEVVRTFEIPEDHEVADGHHTFDDLYAHRLALSAVLAAAAATAGDAWRSKAHHPDDSPMFEGGYFIVGIILPTGVVTYHYKLEHWDKFDSVPEREHAPKWDGATPDDTVTRLLETVAYIQEAAADLDARAQEQALNLAEGE